MGTHGITVEFPDPKTSSRRSATFLPEIALHENWNKATTLEHLARKAGAPALVKETVKLTRYKSTTCSLGYDEYMALKEPKMYRKGAKAERRAAEEAIPVPA